ncbi:MULTISPECIES: nuclear transport factor 2 family protein [unclassified Streptomyces]|uniref:nuclear transport factor 2 family protein n=1 Tax=unclassified Streptomyces TaxID=2593676 RepID=UPI00382F00E8
MSDSAAVRGSEAVSGGRGAESAEGRVNRYYTLVDTGRFDELVALFAPDAVYERPGYEPLEGRAALTDFYTSRRVIAQGRHRLTRVVVDGGNVAAEGIFAGTLRSGDEVSLRFSDFFTVGADGLFSHRVTYFFSELV